MIIDPSEYTALVEEIRILKAMNDVLTYQNKTFLDQFLQEKEEKQKITKEFSDFRQKIHLQHQQLLESCKKQAKTITDELQKKKLQEIAFFEKKLTDLQKSTYQKMKSLEIQFKDHRLKSHLNDEFVNKLLKLYPAENNPGLPELYLWLKKLAAKKPLKEEFYAIGDDEKENTKSMKSMKSSTIKCGLKNASKKGLLEVSK